MLPSPMNPVFYYIRQMDVCAYDEKHQETNTLQSFVNGSNLTEVTLCWRIFSSQFLGIFITVYVNMDQFEYVHGPF